MSRSSELLDRFLDDTQTVAEGEEFARLLKGDGDLGVALYDRIMLEVDLFESYAGIAQLHSIPSRPRPWMRRGLPLAVAAASVFLIGLLALLFGGRTAEPPPPRIVPAAPQLPPPKAESPAPPAPAPKARRELEHEVEEKAAEIEREYRKGLAEVERLRRDGKSREADKKLREIERERDKQKSEPSHRRRDD